MAKATRRDEIWREIVTRRDAADEFTKADIEATTDASSRTVHDVIQTAVEYGLLQKGKERRRLDDPRTERGTQWQEVAVFTPAESAESGDMATENPANGKNPGSNPTPDADTADSTTPDVDFPDASAAAFAESLPRVGDDKARRLYDAGFESYEDLFTASVESLTNVSGIGEKTARAIKTRLVGSALSSMGMEKEALISMETVAVADMFNVPESLADDLQKEISRTQVFG